jgi:transcriptional regulator with XRE-family HTH domain
VPTDPDYAHVIGRNISAARGRLQLPQTAVAERMREGLGFKKWHQQTVANVEKGIRPVKAEELHGLALVLRTTVVRLVKPAEDDRWISLPNGRVVHASSVSMGPGAAWDGNKLVALAGEGWMGDGSPPDPLATAAAIAARHPDIEDG